MIVRTLRSRVQPRRGVAVVEMAFIMPLLLLLIVGVWEIGRLVQLQQIMNGAARDGARIASQANIISTTDDYTQIMKGSGTSDPNVTDTVRAYLYGAGFTTAQLQSLTVTFEFLDGDTSLTEPYQGVKNQRFRVKVSMNYSDVRWTTLTLINPQTIGAECVWQMMVDDPFTLSPTLPGWTP